MSHTRPIHTHFTSLTPGTDKVNSPSREWVEMAIRWELLKDLLGGTIMMRSMGQKWLAREPKETPEQYHIRLHRGILFEGFRDTVERIVSKPFSREVTTKGELPDRLLPMLDNIDRQGSNLTSFSKNLMWDALVHGKTHFVIDFPLTDGNQTMGDEIFGGIHPYFTHVKARDLIGWRSEINEATNESRLTQVRIMETSEVNMGEFATERRERIRVLEPGLFRIFEKAPKDREFIEIANGPMIANGQFLNGIPLVTIYFNKTGFLTAHPPLEGLAWLNLAHWQSSTDHRNYLRFARIGLLTAMGFMQEEIQKGIIVSPNSVIASQNPDAKLAYVEQQGNAFDAGVKDLAMLEDRMEVLGLKPLVRGTAKSTALGKSIDEGKQDSQAQAWIRNIELGLIQGFTLAHKWIGDPIDPEFKVDVFNEFNLTVKAKDDIDRLIKIRTTTPPQISHDTFVNEIRRRGLVGEDVNAENERELLSEELLALLGSS